MAGLETNVNFLLRLSSAPAFVSGDVHTAFIPQHEDALFPQEDLLLTEDRAIQTALGFVRIYTLIDLNKTLQLVL